MVQAMINIPEKVNRVLNIVKAKYNLNDKSEAITVMALQYEEMTLEPQLRPEFVRKMLKQKKEKGIYIGTSEDFRKRYGIKDVPKNRKTKSR